MFIGTAYFFFAKKIKEKNKGLVILGFGMLFLGLSMMSMAVAPLSEMKTARNALVTFGKYPVLGVRQGFWVTVVFQSSSTTTGMIIAFASAGLGPSHFFYLVFGTNIGTCITGILASIGGNLSSKRSAWGNTLFNIFERSSPYSWLLYLQICSPCCRRMQSQIRTRCLMSSTRSFSFRSFFVRAMTKIIPGEDYVKKETKYLDRNLLSVPHLVIKAIISEMIVMLETCADMMHKARQCTVAYDHKLRNEIALDEESVDDMQKNTEYIVELTAMSCLRKIPGASPPCCTASMIWRRSAIIARTSCCFPSAYENDFAFSDEPKGNSISCSTRPMR